MRSKRSEQAVDHAARALSRAGDDQLLALAQAGNSRAFETIVERYRPALTRFCGSLTASERVDDAVQQTFVSAWLAIDRGVLVRDLRPWLYRIAHNAAIDQHRARGLGDGELPEELVGGIDPAHLAAGRTYFEDVLRAVAELPDRQRMALLETAVHGRSTDAVADDLGVSGGALRQLVHRARATVRTTVASLGAGPLTSWLGQLGSDDSSLRRVATALGGAGSGTVAALSKTTAAVVSAGAIAAGGIVSTSEYRSPATRATASSAATTSGGSRGGATSATAGATASASATAHVGRPVSGAASGHVARPSSAVGATAHAVIVSLPSRSTTASADDAPSRRSGAGEHHSSASSTPNHTGRTSQHHDSTSTYPPGDDPDTSSTAAGTSRTAAVAQPVPSSITASRGGRNCDPASGQQTTGTSATAASAASAPAAAQPTSAGSATPAVVSTPAAETAPAASGTAGADGASAQPTLAPAASATGAATQS